MFGFRRTLAQTGARACLAAGAVLAVFALSAISATSAMASPECVKESMNIQGKGASLQRVSQELWTGGEVPSNELKGLPHTLKTGLAELVEALSFFPESSKEGKPSTSSGKPENGFEDSALIPPPPRAFRRA